MAYPDNWEHCAGCGKDLTAVGGATITITDLKPRWKNQYGLVQALVCNDAYTPVYVECFNKAWTKYSKSEPPER